MDTEHDDEMDVHPQVRCLDFECDEDLAELLTAMNARGFPTITSCQDNNAGRGRVRRVWVEVHTWDLEELLELLSDPAELGDAESLSCRMASEYEPDDWQDYRESRCWHYDISVGRINGDLFADAVGIRFPYTDLAEVTARLQKEPDTPGADTGQAGDAGRETEQHAPF